MIHCHAGVSRSPAIAISYAWWKGDLNLTEAIMNKGKYIPNGYVLKVMANKLNVENNDNVKKLLKRLYHPEDYDIEE